MNAYLADLTCRLCSATLLLLSLSACIGTSVGNPSSDQENSGGDEATGGDDREQDAGQSTDTSVGEADAYEPDDDTGAAGEDSIDSPRFCASETECDTGERCVDEICRLSCDVESSEVDGGEPAGLCPDGYECVHLPSSATEEAPAEEDEGSSSGESEEDSTLEAALGVCLPLQQEPPTSETEGNDEEPAMDAGTPGTDTPDAG